jgi:hypothetical protein
MVTSDAEGAVVVSLKRKQRDAELMSAGMVREMSIGTDVRAAERDATEYNPTRQMSVPSWVGSEAG